jgi:hypothetical protein
MFVALIVASLLLVIGDFLSTFCYHVPEHVFGQLHVKTHHSAKQTFRHYAILTAQFSVLLDGFLGALPYLVLGILFWRISSGGVLIGLLLGLVHVWWRHITFLGWKTPAVITWICRLLFITTPERHYQHHHRPNQGFGDIFIFFERPAQQWLRWLRLLRRTWHPKTL